MERNKKYLIYIILFFIIGLIIRNFLDNRYKKLMTNNTIITKAVFVRSFVSKNSGSISVYSFDKNGEKEEVLISGKSSLINMGDTILIKYSREDPSLAEVIDFSYMKK
jgi:hypothetical protein